MPRSRPGPSQLLEGRAAGSAGSRFRSGAALLAEDMFLNGFASSSDMRVVDKGYAQSLMAVGYLLEGRRAGGFRHMLAALGKGESSQDALRGVYGMSLEQMLQAAKQNK